MKQAIISIALILAIVFAVAAIPIAISDTDAAYAGDENCMVQTSNNSSSLLICDGNLVKKIPIPVISTTVTIPAPTAPPAPAVPTVTVTVPGPTQTVYRPGKKIEVPGPTKTIYYAEIETRTKYLPYPKPVFLTETVTASGQPNQTSATVGSAPSPSSGEETSGGNDTASPFSKVPAKIIGISTLTALALLALILLGMYIGYYIGYKDSDKENANFMAALSDSIIVRGKR
jgi:hypothetical protein